MLVDENEFFRNATLRICGDLALEQALHQALLYVGEFIPLDAFFMEYFDARSGTMRTIARADRRAGIPLDLLTPIPGDAHLDEKLKPPMSKVMVFNRPDEIPMATTMLRFHGYDEHNTSLLAMRLIEQGEMFGGLVAVAGRRDIFTDEHARLLASVAQPFTIALVNALRHREVMDTRDRLVDENEFFRNVTTRICGNLVLEEGLRACMEYLAGHIPGYAMFLQRYDHELGAMRLVARADPNKGERMDTLVPLPAAARDSMRRARDDVLRDTLPPVLVFNDPDSDPTTRAMLDELRLPPSSVMSLPLILGDQAAGALALLAEGRDRFNEDHIRLFSTLKVPFFVAMSNTLRHREVLELKDRLADDNRYLNREMIRIAGDEIVGVDFGLRSVMRMVQQVATTESPVLLTGETGVGKDVVASAIHMASERRSGPFIAVNCGAIPETLLDSELFGHEKGAFTGALAQKRGRFERADGGTIFLDEIGEMPLTAQVRLLRVLQNREIERIGGTERIPVDIRIIAATNRDLEELVQAGRFREDLWFRLNVFPIEIPPLRERSGDIPALVQHFVERKARELKLGQTPALAPGEIDRLYAYSWPGNVRELENLIERALILHRGEPLRFESLASEDRARSSVEPPVDGESLPDLNTVIARHIRRALEASGGKIHGQDGAGALLGVNPNTLRAKMRKLGIPFGRNTMRAVR